MWTCPGKKMKKKHREKKRKNVKSFFLDKIE